MDITESFTKKGINLELFLCSEILKLPSLHFGYWEKDDALNMENMRKAQVRYNEQVATHVPAGVSSILDVGCGVGDISGYLSGKG